MSQLEAFGFESAGQNFEDNSNENGFTFWYATKVMEMLDYEGWSSFQKAINKAMATCTSLNIPVIENFLQEVRIIDGKQVNDIKLSRFACYLTVMNGDTRKPAVAKAQAYFASLAGAVQHYLEESEKVERIQIRNEISEREISLSSVVKRAGVQIYGYFQNAGYRGMYNKNINQLKQIRGVDGKKTLLDFMGKEELAANLFRITQTELKIRNEKIAGQDRLESAAFEVGRKVRKTMIEISNVAPENLPKHEDINEVKKGLKKKGKELKLIDQKKKKSK